VLVGIAVERKTKPIGSLLLSAVLLLIWNPLWIWDLGAQLSFLATLGLLVTSPWIEAELDWLPASIAPLISVPIAAYIWTIPLQMQMFGVVSPYSILANILTTPLVSALSLGGFASAILAIAQADLGSWSAWLLHYPTSWLLGIVDLCGRLPGNSIAVGTTPLLLTLVLYGTLGLLWWKPDLRRYSGALVLATMVLVFVPAWQVQANLVRITALVTADQPILVVQERGRVGLINSGQANTAQMTVLPFLQQQGINRLDWAVALQAGDGWEKVGVPIGALYALDPTQIPQSLPLTDFQVGQVRVQRLNTEPPLIQVQVQNYSWLLAPQAPKATAAVSVAVSATVSVAAPGLLPAAAVLWWSGGRMPVGLPAVGGAIAYGKQLKPQTEQQLQALGVPVFWLRRDGAVQWTPRGGLAPAVREHLD
jgi:competence protein ComEC